MEEIGDRRKIILHLEDSKEDAEILVDKIRRSGFKIEYHLVSVKDKYIDILDKFLPDVIIIDLKVPGFEGVEPILIARQYHKSVPIIVLTGAVGEEMAVNALKAGAADFILKDNIERIIPVLERAFYERKIILEKDILNSELKEFEEKYKNLLENLPVGIFRTTTESPGKFLNANIETARMYGLSSVEQLLQIYVEDIYQNPEERKLLQEEIKSKKKVKNILVNLKRIDGTPFLGSISASCHFNNKGEVDWIDGVIEDVTEKAQLQEKLKSYSNFFETLLDTINSPVFYKDIYGRYIGCNKYFSELIIGAPKEEILNKTLFELKDYIPYELALKYEEMDKKLLENPGIQEYDYFVRCSDGKLRYFHFNKSVYRDSKGNVAGIVGIMIDITESVENQQKLIQSNEELSLLINSLPSIIIGVSVKDIVTQWNPFAEKILGLKAEDVIGKRFYETRIKWNWEKIYETIGQCIVNRKGIRLDDLKFETEDGKTGILGLSVNPLIRGGDSLEGFMILGRDVTEQRILESQVFQSNKLEAIGQLAAGIAHEINTPLQYVGDNLKFITKSFEGILKLIEKYREAYSKWQNNETPDFKSFFEEIVHIAREIKLDFIAEQIPPALSEAYDGLQRVSKIVQSIKAFSHPGTGEKTSVDINKAIENTITVSRNQWKYDSEVIMDFDPDLPLVPCFESEFNQVVLNLIINASDAIHEAKEKGIIEHGIIKITTSVEEGYAVVKVSDNGTGIPEKIRNRIFDPFFTTKEPGKGTGQGLPISHSIIVEKHQGMLYFESEIGKGTTFIIKLPQMSFYLLQGISRL
ncbi:MAG TPA: PAS domain S-box protein [Spirochaetota bacterium]|nr:PAS domain S-box protein [Spirochaetota bacterium]